MEYGPPIYNNFWKLDCPRKALSRVFYKSHET